MKKKKERKVSSSPAGVPREEGKSEMEKLREKQQRRRRRRTLRILAISPLIALLFVAGISFLTRVNTVVLRNSSRYESLEIRDLCSFSVGDSLFSVDRDKLSDTITSTCPYVKTARVEYGFPNRIEISLTPATVAFAMEYERIRLADSADTPDAPEEFPILLMDSDFKVLEGVEAAPESLLLVKGIDLMSYEVGRELNREDNLQVSVVENLIAVLQQKGLYEHASQIDLTRKYNVTVQIYGVITVEFGNSEDLDAKVNMLVKILSENDLSVPAKINVQNPAKGRYVRLPVTDTESSAFSSDLSSEGASSGDGQGETTDSGTPNDEKTDNS